MGERQRARAAQGRRRTGSIEYLNGGVDGDLAWLTFIESASVEFVSILKARSADGIFVLGLILRERVAEPNLVLPSTSSHEAAHNLRGKAADQSGGFHLVANGVPSTGARWARTIRGAQLCPRPRNGEE